MPSTQYELRLDRDDGAEGVVQRFDRASLPRAVRTPEGYLRCDATPIARVGSQTYFRADGSQQVELRLPEDVGAEASLDSLLGKPLVRNHPAEGLVDALSYGQHAAGSVHNARLDGDLLVADLVVCRADAVKAVESGELEISGGYTTRAVPVAEGVFRQDGHPLDGTKADVLQTDIRFNHVALVRKARANTGTTDRPVRIRLDGAGHQIREDESTPPARPAPTRSTPTMETITINGQTFQVSAEVAAAYRADAEQRQKLIAEATAKAAEADKKATEATQRADAAEGKAAAAEAKATELEKVRTDAADDEKKAALEAERYGLLQAAAEATKKPVAELVRLDSAALQAAVLKVKAPQLKLDGRSPEFIAAAYEFQAAQAKTETPDDTPAEPRVDAAAQLAGMNPTAPPKAEPSPLAAASDHFRKRLEGRADR